MILGVIEDSNHVVADLSMEESLIIFLELNNGLGYDDFSIDNLMSDVSNVCGYLKGELESFFSKFLNGKSIGFFSLDIINPSSGDCLRCIFGNNPNPPDKYIGYKFDVKNLLYKAVDKYIEDETGNYIDNFEGEE